MSHRVANAAVAHNTNPNRAGEGGAFSAITGAKIVPARAQKLQIPDDVALNRVGKNSTTAK